MLLLLDLPEPTRSDPFPWLIHPLVCCVCVSVWAFWLTFFSKNYNNNDKQLSENGQFEAPWHQRGGHLWIGGEKEGRRGRAKGRSEQEFLAGGAGQMQASCCWWGKRCGVVCWCVCLVALLLLLLLCRFLFWRCCLIVAIVIFLLHIQQSDYCWAQFGILKLRCGVYFCVIKGVT